MRNVTRALNLLTAAFVVSGIVAFSTQAATTVNSVNRFSYGANLQARLIRGRSCINVVHAHFGHKGRALRNAQAWLRCPAAIYVGDDETDEDAFAAGRADRLLSVRIGNARRSRAAYRLKDQRQIDRFLRKLLTLRSASK